MENSHPSKLTIYNWRDSSLGMSYELSEKALTRDSKKGPPCYDFLKRSFLGKRSKWAKGLGLDWALYLWRTPRQSMRQKQ